MFDGGLLSFFSGCTSGVLLKKTDHALAADMADMVWMRDHPDVVVVDVLLLQQHCEGEMPNWKACDDQH